MLVTKLLNSPSHTHLLFIDADMGFQPSLIEKMLAFDRPFVGAIVPGRRAGTSFISGPEVFWRDADGRYVVDGDFVRVKQAGTGILLIKREAIEALAARYPQLWGVAGAHYARMGLTGERVFQPFEAIQHEANGAFLSEDLSFCKRWRGGLGGEIWVCFTETVEHVGRHRFTGNPEELVRRTLAAQDA